MATVKQRFEAVSRQIDGNGSVTGCEIPYLVFFDSNETANEALALSAVKAFCPDAVDDAELSQVAIGERLNERLYSVTASYSSTTDNSADSGEKAQVSFDCGAGTNHIINAIAQQKTSGSPDVGLIIGCDKWGDNPQGCDIVKADLRESYSKRMKISSAGNNSFKRKVAECVGKINSSSFKGWEAGEVLFLGCSYSGRKGETVQVTFNFAISQNETNKAVGVDKNGNTIRISKKGWQYFWTMLGTQNASPKRYCEGVYVADVYNKANFNQLGV